MKANTYIRINNEPPIRVKEEIHVIANQISMNNLKSFHFIEITQIVELTDGAQFEEDTQFAEEKRYININFIRSFEAVILEQKNRCTCDPIRLKPLNIKNQ